MVLFGYAETSSPRPGPNIRLDPQYPLLMEQGMSLSDNLIDSVPGSFYRIR